MKNTPKIFISPVNEPIFKSIIKNNFSVGFILSQRQFNLNGGYISPSIIQQITNSRHVLERDHFCLIEYDEKVIDFDSEIFDLIHIDPWYFGDVFHEDCNQWMQRFLQQNDNIFFEFGTEDFIKELSLSEFRKSLDKIATYLDKIHFLVCQGGSVVFDCRNISPIDIKKTKEFVKIGEEYNMKIKRHNCDFHTNEELKILSDLGVESFNYAPEFSYISNSVIYKKLNIEDKDYFLKKIENNAPWKRWIYDLKDEEKAIKSCLHYLDSDEKMQNYLFQCEDEIINLVSERLEEICHIL